MTSQSLENIIKVENVLQDQEQAEKEKAAHWLQEKKAEILADYEDKLVELEREKEQVKVKAVKEVEKKAARIIGDASDHAKRLDNISDEQLVTVLKKRFVSIIAGQ